VSVALGATVLSVDAKERSVCAPTEPVAVALAATGAGCAAGTAEVEGAVEGWGGTETPGAVVAGGVTGCGGVADTGAFGGAAAAGAVAPVGGGGAEVVVGAVAPVGQGTAAAGFGAGEAPDGGGTAVCARTGAPKVRIERTERHPTVLIFPLENSLARHRDGASGFACCP
jgi:hypothetical protein